MDREQDGAPGAARRVIGFITAWMVIGMVVLIGAAVWEPLTHWWANRTVTPLSEQAATRGDIVALGAVLLVALLVVGRR